jgi:deazaflavin-dependent oxidoreductase (nitroreductase family)
MIELHEIEREAVDSPREWARNHVDQYLESGGTKTDHPHTDRLILLYTKGKRSGAIRRTPLVHFESDLGYLIVASQGGAPTHPSWYHNLLADPQVWVRDRDDFFEARADVLTPAERPPAWEYITSELPFFAEYQEKTDRVIPVVRLTRVEA